MRTHVHTLAEPELWRAHLVKNDEGPDHLALGGGQGPPDLEGAQVPRAEHTPISPGFTGSRSRRRSDVREALAVQHLGHAALVAPQGRRDLVLEQAP